VANSGSGEGTFTANLSGLNPSTLYYARAFAINANDTAYGAQISFTTQPGTPVQTVDVTYKVDVTNYLNAGNTIAANGIRIAGNFADRGAKVNGTSMVNWTPTDAASAMSNTGGNIWSLTITYPDTASGKVQSYKFVNGNWGSNEGGPGSNILSGGCGADDGSGNINRVLVIPTANSSLSYCWDQCEPICNPTSVSSVIPAEINAYPNPFDAELNIVSYGADSFKIISLLGKVVSEGNLKSGKNRIETSGLPKGIYLLSTGEKSLKRIVKN
jgi:hypothetical protein